jgi:polygalacturonase
MNDVYNVNDYGAKGDGVTFDTAAIQSAIDRCSSSGGGTVLFSKGKFLTGTIYIKSNVTLHLAPAAVLLGSADITQYADDTDGIRYIGEEYMDPCLIFARNAKNIAITGFGIIDGQGSKDNFPPENRGVRPMLVRLIECRNVTLKDVRIRNAAAWTFAIIHCSDVRAEGLTINSTVNWNGDGLDFDGCENVFVSNCRITTSDDSICLQTSEADRPCRNVTITNCVMSSKWAAMRIGMLSCGNIENVTVSNCIFHDISDCGLKIQMTEGAEIKNMIFSNIVMTNTPIPIFITLNALRLRRGLEEEPPSLGIIKDLHFSNIRASDIAESSEKTKSFIGVIGVPQQCIENITFDNIHFIAPGGGKQEDADRKDIPELINQRPEHSVLGESLPCYGMYLRHAKNILLNNVRLDTEKPDCRPAIFTEDVDGMKITGHCPSVNY